MHKRTSYQSCTDYRRSTADATLRFTILPITQHMPFKVFTNLRQKTNHGETTVGSTVTSTHMSLTTEQPAHAHVPAATSSTPCLQISEHQSARGYPKHPGTCSPTGRLYRRAPPWLNGSTSTMRNWRSWVQFPWVTFTFNVDIAQIFVFYLAMVRNYCGLLW